MQNIKIQRFEYLDGLRGVAALIVVINHFRNAFVDFEKQSFINSFLWKRLEYFIFSGHFCVQLFFVLSGFVLAFNSFNRIDFLQNQWTKRFVRLTLPVFLTSIIYMLFSNYDLFYFKEILKIYYNGWIAVHWNIKYTYIQFLVKCLYDFMLFADWNFGMNINSSLWTIPIELYWSYLLFIIFFVVNKLKKLLYKNLIFIVYALIMLMFYSFIGKEFALLFLFGAFLALNSEIVTTWQNNKKSNVILCIITIVLTYIIERNWLAEFEISDIKFESIIAILFLVVILRIKFIQKIFSFSAMKWLGRISFPLYLLHILVIGSISSKLFILFPFMRVDFGLLILLIITLILSFGISHIYTVFVDEPLMKLYDRYYKMLVSKLKTDEII